MIPGTLVERCQFIIGRGDSVKINMLFCEIEIDWRAISVICICTAIIYIAK